MGKVRLKIDCSVIIPGKERCLVVISVVIDFEQGSDCEKGNKRKGKE